MLMLGTDSKNTKPVAAIIIEPIASEGGDHHAPPSFFRGLRELTTREGVSFIVGELRIPKQLLSLTLGQTRSRPASARRGRSGRATSGSCPPRPTSSRSPRRCRPLDSTTTSILVHPKRIATL